MSSEESLASDCATGNAFQQTLLGLTYKHAPSMADLFSKACGEEYETADLDRFGYRLSQVFESDVLWEVTRLAGVDYERTIELSEGRTPRIRSLAEQSAHPEEFGTVRLISIAAALTSISRFAVANRVLDVATARSTSPRENFEIAMLRFVTSNRLGDADNVRGAFRAMRRAIASDEVPNDRIVDACSQAVVWYAKVKAIPVDEFDWFAARGHALTGKRKAVDDATRSSWFRAWAMIPAEQGNVTATHAAMQEARRAADLAVVAGSGVYETHLVKTYYESTLKEHMYISRDMNRAVEAGRALIELDPVWGPSYGELADAYAHFGNYEAAAELYENAISHGPPYVGHHTLAAARCRDRNGDLLVALGHYESLAKINPTSRRLLAEVVELATRAASVGHPAHDYFATVSARIDSAYGESADV